MQNPEKRISTVVLGRMHVKHSEKVGNRDTAGPVDVGPVTWKPRSPDGDKVVVIELVMWTRG